jgi:hypothetical protein
MGQKSLFNSSPGQWPSIGAPLLAAPDSVGIRGRVGGTGRLPTPMSGERALSLDPPTDMLRHGCRRFVFLTVVRAQRLCRLLFLRLVRVREGVGAGWPWP